MNPGKQKRYAMMTLSMHSTLSRQGRFEITSMIPLLWTISAATGSMDRIARSTGPTQKLTNPQKLKMA
jgi:hypothetical protein